MRVANRFVKRVDSSISETKGEHLGACDAFSRRSLCCYTATMPACICSKHNNIAKTSGISTSTNLEQYLIAKTHAKRTVYTCLHGYSVEAGQSLLS